MRRRLMAPTISSAASRFFFSRMKASAPDSNIERASASESGLNCRLFAVKGSGKVVLGNAVAPVNRYGNASYKIAARARQKYCGTSHFVDPSHSSKWVRDTICCIISGWSLMGAVISVSIQPGKIAFTLMPC